MLESPKNFPNECLEDYYLMVIAFVETYNSVDIKSEKSNQCGLILILAFSIFIMLTSVTETFSQKSGSIDISVVNSSFIPLTNTDANQVKVNVEYALEDEKIQNQLINAVMEVSAPNGTLIKTTSIGSGFTLQSDGGEQVLRTTLHDKSLQSVSIKIVLTDLSKKTPLSNEITDDLKLKDASKAD
jgi:hypothetical protein